MTAGSRIKMFSPRYTSQEIYNGLKNAFLDAIPDRGRMFDPEVRRCDISRLEIKLRRCPLKDD